MLLIPISFLYHDIMEPKHCSPFRSTGDNTAIAISPRCADTPRAFACCLAFSSREAPPAPQVSPLPLPSSRTRKPRRPLLGGDTRSRAPRFAQYRRSSSLDILPPRWFPENFFTSARWISGARHIAYIPPHAGEKSRRWAPRASPRDSKQLYWFAPRCRRRLLAATADASNTPFLC